MKNKWKDSTIGKECIVVMGQSPPSSEYNKKGDGLPFYQGKKEFGELHPKPLVWTRYKGKKALKNDILISVRAPVGDININIENSIIGRGLAALRSSNYKLLFYYLKLNSSKLEKQATGSTFSAISKITLLNFPFSYPESKQEQQQIISEIEKQFTRLDASVKDLESVKEKLKIYRKSVLKAAFENKLIKIENWIGTNIEKISENIQYGLTSESGENFDGPKYLRITDIQNRKVDWNNVPFAKENENIEKYLLNAGDLVFARTGATVGKSFLIEECPKGSVFASYLIRVIPNRNKILPELLWYYFQSSTYWHFISKQQRGIGQPNVNGQILASLPINIPKKTSDQMELINEIESRFSVIDKLEQSVDSALNKTEQLRKSILKSAFEGKLVTFEEVKVK